MQGDKYTMRKRIQSKIIYILYALICINFVYCKSIHHQKTTDNKNIRFLSDSSKTPETISVKVAAIHYNPILRDEKSNIILLRSLITEAFINGANIVVTPELSTTGYSIKKKDVLEGLGYKEPFHELDQIKNVAIKHKGYVFMGIAEKTSKGKIYNSAIIIGPDGNITKHRKRSDFGWSDYGNLPLRIIHTKFGDLGVLVCSDSYRPDCVRILAIKGADILFIPSNWYGLYQLNIWKTRARENGIWLIAANRWGIEHDTGDKGDDASIINFNNAPSVFITPDGKMQHIYESRDDPNPTNRILYYSAKIPQSRIGNSNNPVCSINNRNAGTYSQISNQYYLKSIGNKPMPNLPVPGSVVTASISYKPSKSSDENLKKIQQIWSTKTCRPDIVVLPALGIIKEKIIFKSRHWFREKPWSVLQNFVESEKIKLLVTTLKIYSNSTKSTNQSLLVLQPNKLPQLIGQIHDTESTIGTHMQPFFFDIPKARVGIITGYDSLFPELVVALAKSGIDILIISSSIGTEEQEQSEKSSNRFWKSNDLICLWKTRVSNSIHLVASDWIGCGIIIKNELTHNEQALISNLKNPIIEMKIDSSSVRSKFLNDYKGYDLDVFLK